MNALQRSPTICKSLGVTTPSKCSSHETILAAASMKSCLEVKYGVSSLAEGRTDSFFDEVGRDWS